MASKGSETGVAARYALALFELARTKPKRSGPPLPFRFPWMPPWESPRFLVRIFVAEARNSLGFKPLYVRSFARRRAVFSTCKIGAQPASKCLNCRRWRDPGIANSIYNASMWRISQLEKIKLCQPEGIIRAPVIGIG